MPLYEAQCRRCGSYLDYYSTVEEREETPYCCGERAIKIIRSAPALNLDIAPWDAYESPATGKMITSRRQREADLAASGCRPWEGAEQERKEAARQRQYAEEANDRELDKQVTAAFQLLPEPLKALTSD